MGKENDTVDKTCGERLREARKAAKLNRAELGEKVGYSGVQIGRFERGDNRIPLETAEKFEEVFRIRADYFTGKSDFKTRAEENAALKKRIEQMHQAKREEQDRDEEQERELTLQIIHLLGRVPYFCNNHDECEKRTGIPFWELIGISEKAYHVLLEEGWWEDRHDGSGWLIDNSEITDYEYKYCWIEEDVMKSLVHDAVGWIGSCIFDIMREQTLGCSKYNKKHSVFSSAYIDNIYNAENDAYNAIMDEQEDTLING